MDKKRTIDVSQQDVEATMPAWVKADTPAVRELFLASLEWRMQMFTEDQDTQDRIREYAREWDLARHTITLAEAERRWGKANLRQSPPDRPFRWQSDDGRGTWLTTTWAMERVYGPEPPRVEIMRMGSDQSYHVHIFGFVAEDIEALAIPAFHGRKPYVFVDVTGAETLAHVTAWCEDLPEARYLAQELGKRLPDLQVDLTPHRWWKRWRRDHRTGVIDIVE